ncbi:MAG TPA: hypothetical protein VGH89_22135 [Pseudonocardia sp.]
MRDAQACSGRRAWTGCPRCADHRGCRSCESGLSCPTHWRFLLAAQGRHLFVQCRGCWHRWWHDTGFGVGDRPAQIDELADFPPRGRTAA